MKQTNILIILICLAASAGFSIYIGRMILEESIKISVEQTPDENEFPVSNYGNEAIRADGDIIDATRTSCPTSFAANGCSVLDFQVVNALSQNVSFGFNPSSICDRHDICYRSLSAGKLNCDRIFGSELKDKCKKVHCRDTILGNVCSPTKVTCDLGAEAYEGAVRQVGIGKYDKKQAQRVGMLEKCGKDGYLAPKSPFETGSEADYIAAILKANNRTSLNAGEFDKFKTQEFQGNARLEKIAAYIKNTENLPTAGDYDFPPPPCPGNYYFDGSDKCYKKTSFCTSEEPNTFIAIGKTWIDAQRKCRKPNGQIATIFTYYRCDEGGIAVVTGTNSNNCRDSGPIP